ncbi:hypothetical protein PanWU01x14_363690 [Parasponia andersonii]|uniref:Uncharacterized protein n=1 Tax=Parasponia andersonii TaxID=3476 RepID=A0A2P5A6J3_PARAD|nr:hypothetical protein PanWU01x14_363690 [Parasponia andersonii]
MDLFQLMRWKPWFFIYFVSSTIHSLDHLSFLHPGTILTIEVVIRRTIIQKCDFCKHFIPTNHAGLIEYRAHPFWIQKYCPSHEHDGTPRCCTCERMDMLFRNVDHAFANI